VDCYDIVNLVLDVVFDKILKETEGEIKKKCFC